jgi:hypothetical protein
MVFHYIIMAVLVILTALTVVDILKSFHFYKRVSFMGALFFIFNTGELINDKKYSNYI